MSLNTQSAPMEDSFPDNNEHMSLGIKFAPMLNTLRDIQSEFQANGAENYISSTTSQTVGPAGTQKFSSKQILRMELEKKQR